MCECGNHLLPTIGIVTDVYEETSDVKTFRVEAIGGGKPFEHMPGQCAILSELTMHILMLVATHSKEIDQSDAKCLSQLAQSFNFRLSFLIFIM